MSRKDPTGHRYMGGGADLEALPADGLSALQTRYSMQSQRSFEGQPLQHPGGASGHRRSLSNGSAAFSPRAGRGTGDREGLMNEWDAEHQAFGLADLAEESDCEHDVAANGKQGIAMNGSHVRKPD